MISSCHHEKKAFKTQGKDAQRFKTPPGGIAVAENLFIDETEVTNQFWLDYVHWLKLHYGKSSNEVLSAKLVEHSFASDMDNSAYEVQELYLHHPAFSDFPCVGMDYEQAFGYCKWRTERVLEGKLLLEKYITVKEMIDTNHRFSIDTFFQTSHPELKEEKLIPLYSLPSESDIKYILEAPDENNCVSYQKKRERKKKSEKYSWMIRSTVLTSVFDQCANSFGIRGGDANVSEISLENVTLYGRYNIAPTDDFNASPYSLSAPDSYVGFRCVCRWVTYDEYQKFWAAHPTN
jgi:hypothetical protein